MTPLPLGRLAAATLACGVLCAGTALAQSGPPAGLGEKPSIDSDAKPSFDLVIRAPDTIRALLEKHLELRRFREVSDLDDAELARLIAMAEKDARELVATLGYFSAKVTIAREGKDRPTLVVTVEPGEPATVANVDIAFEGDIATTRDAEAIRQRESIRAGWLLARGQRFTQDAWGDAKTAATRELTARRYPAGRISYSLADVDPRAHVAHLGLKIDSGPLFKLGPMQVTGTKRYDPVLVPRLARLPAGAVYDRDEIVRAQLRLTGSGYYDTAFIVVDPEGDAAAAPVQVTVREAPMQKVVLGVGLTTDSGPRVSVEHTHNRVPGLGWRFVSKLQADRKTPFLQTEGMAVPDATLWRWSALARIERLDDGTLVTHAQRLRFGRLRSEEHIDRNVYVQYDHATVQTEAGLPVPAFESGAGSAVSVNYVWTGRYFDNLTSPTRGRGIGFELGGGVTLGADHSPFQRTVIRWLSLHPLGEGRIQLRGEAGAVIARSSAQIPGTQMFRTGGDTTVRGYGYREIGVLLPNGLVGPGRYEAVGSVEWQKPLRIRGKSGNFESVLFVDAGSVADRVSQMRAWVGAGTGVRWKSPVGPLEADIAYGFKAHHIRLHMSVGFTF